MANDGQFLFSFLLGEIKEWISFLPIGYGNVNLFKEISMYYLEIELTKGQREWWQTVNSRFDHGKKENEARDDSKNVALRNAILILEDEFKCKKDKKEELIVFDVELEKNQFCKKEDNYKKHTELISKIENKANSIGYIYHRLLDIKRSDMLDIIFKKIETCEKEAYVRILNKFLLEVLKEEVEHEK